MVKNSRDSTKYSVQFREVSRQKKQIVYGQADRKPSPPPRTHPPTHLAVSFLWFLGVHFTLEYDYIYFPGGSFKSFNNNLHILMFSSRLDMKSSVGEGVKKTVFWDFFPNYG